MNPIKIFSEKICVRNRISYTGFINYTNNLTKLAKQHHGFISSESFIKEPFEYDSDIPIKVITISQWDSIYDWNNWHSSGSRRDVYNNYRDVIDTENFNLLFKKKNNDIFLL